MALDQSALLEVLDALKAADVGDRVRSSRHYWSGAAGWTRRRTRCAKRPDRVRPADR
jgi:hypothetical protein